MLRGLPSYISAGSTSPEVIEVHIISSATGLIVDRNRFNTESDGAAPVWPHSSAAPFVKRQLRHADLAALEAVCDEVEAVRERLIREHPELLEDEVNPIS